MEGARSSRRSREEMLAMVEQAQRVLKAPRVATIRPAGIDLPRVQFPHFASVGAEVEEAAERWRKMVAPITAVSEELGRRIEAMQASMAPYTEHLRWLQEQERQCELLEGAGWLPHCSSPFHFLEEGCLDSVEVDREVGDFYEESWDRISADLRSGIEACDLDQEAKDCFGEALSAHGAGFYRCAPRLLYPEIERVARVEIHGGAFDKMASQNRLVAAIGGLTPAEMSSTGVTGLRFYKKLTEHLYLHLKDADRIAVAGADPVPNRHAAVHGLVSYTSQKSSINAILIADYLLQAISVIKSFERRGAEIVSNNRA